jgi:hypothetical protein
MPILDGTCGFPIIHRLRYLHSASRPAPRVINPAPASGVPNDDLCATCRTRARRDTRSCAYCLSMSTCALTIRKARELIKTARLHRMRSNGGRYFVRRGGKRVSYSLSSLSGAMIKKAAEHRALRPPGSKMDCLLNAPSPGVPSVIQPAQDFESQGSVLARNKSNCGDADTQLATQSLMIP